MVKRTNENDTGSDFRIKMQVALALDCLQTMIPFCDKAGIVSNFLDAYDEWEILTQAVFNAFVVYPVCDETGLYSPNEFQKLGYVPKPRKYLIKFTNLGQEYFIYDLVKDKSSQMVIEAIKKDNFSEIICMNVEHCHEFDVYKLNS